MSQWVAGVDGCPKWKWVAALMNLDRPETVIMRRIDAIEQLLDAPESPSVIAIDIPIGLPDRAGDNAGRPDTCVRPFLGSFGSSVYPVPARPVLEAFTGWPQGRMAIAREHQRLCDVAERLSDPPARMTIQTFGLMPRIREVDLLLKQRPKDAARIREVHPEVAFWSMNGERELKGRKKTLEGQRERQKLLLQSGIPESVVYSSPQKGVKQDDHLDALAGLVVARHIAQGTARSFPETPVRDATGVEMAIWSFGQ